MRRLSEYASGAGRKRVAQNILRLAANVADTETITIGRDVFEIETTGGVTAGRIAVDCTSKVTPTLAGPLIVAAINTYNTQKLVAVELATGILLVYGAGLPALACAETLGGSGNAWDAAAMAGANADVATQTLVTQRAAIAAEVSEGAAYFVMPFTVVGAMCAVRTTAGVAKAWDGVTSFTGNRVKMDNAGSSDWAATDVLVCMASG